MAFEFISGINDCANLFQLVSSGISYLRHQKLKEDDVLQLQGKLKCLDRTLVAMYDLINRAEWRSHKANVAKQLPELKDAVYDAEDLLDEFKWYGLKVSARGNATVEQASVIEFYCSVIEGRFNKIVDIQERLDTVSSQLKEMDLDQGTPRFDKLVRVESSSFPAESNMIGREKEMTDVIEMLSRASSKRKEPGSGGAPPVLPIVGIGGVGKTTLAQHISEHKHVASRFKKNVIWICVSDDFDVNRLTKEALQSFSGTQTSGDNLDSLQRDLEKSVKNKRLLLVLDDMWDDALRDNGLHWKTFCKPFRNVLHGSMIMVTTRSQNVANQVGTMNSILLEGLKDDVFWDFFKSCAFGKDSAHSYPELESIGESILPKLRGSPLAAKTLGRVLGANLDTTHWNNILRSELWELPQQDTEILPALRLSYIYLPFHLKRCFSFCAVYPKDQNFEKESLAEIWVAEGFVEPQADIPVQDIGCSYFEDLVNRSMFQKSNSRSKYVIHDLMHDMAQLVLKDECFIIKKESDFDAVPKRVRHLFIYKNRDIKSSSLLDIRKHTRLRTLLCNKSLWNNTPVMEQWCSELRCLRVFSCVSTRELPESINNMKHLRYLDISGSHPFRSLPCPYNLQILYARKCKFDSLPSELNMLISLQKVETETLLYNRRPVILAKQPRPGKALTLMNYPGDLVGSRDTFGRISLYGNSQGINLNERPEELLGRNSDIFGRIFSSLMDLTIEGCKNLSSLEHFVQPEYVPAIKKIKIMASSFISYWAELQKEGDKMTLEKGAEALREAAMAFHPAGPEEGDSGTVLIQ